MDLPTAAGLALGSLADAALGDPRRRHPVAGFGQAAAALERRVWRDDRATGAAYWAVCVGTVTALGTAADRLTRSRPLTRAALTALVTWSVLGGTSLGRAGTTQASQYPAPAVRESCQTARSSAPAARPKPATG